MDPEDHRGHLQKVLELGVVGLSRSPPLKKDNIGTMCIVALGTCWVPYSITSFNFPICSMATLCLTCHLVNICRVPEVWSHEAVCIFRMQTPGLWAQGI